MPQCCQTAVLSSPPQPLPRPSSSASASASATALYCYLQSASSGDNLCFPTTKGCNQPSDIFPLLPVSLFCCSAVFMASAVASSHQQAHFCLSSPCCGSRRPLFSVTIYLLSLLHPICHTQLPPALLAHPLHYPLLFFVTILSDILCSEVNSLLIGAGLPLRQATSAAYDAIDGACSFPLSVIALRSNDPGDIFLACDNPGDIFTACDNPNDIFTACDNLVVKP
ncbi:hypothetical protein B296_00052553 [Ensete ventricosum]|uniref:Uncharacterized protein n=1 Tax=Ensete ventricosum TaxID=4639 RepID=A0A426XNV9_ENSVE|nr:hypothetical protein B296_00052553 [Ensete ventricosum]